MSKPKKKPSKRKPSSISRQREWQKRKLAEGKCVICGKPREHYAEHCDECWKKIAPGGLWRPGKRGRPPNTARDEFGNVIYI